MAGAVVLLLFLGFNFLSGKKTSRSTKVVETGTEGDDGVDYEWIPKSALRNTPASGKTSPRQRKNKDVSEEGRSLLQRPTPSDPDASHHLDYLQQTGHCILINEFSFSFDTLAKI